MISGRPDIMFKSRRQNTFLGVADPWLECPECSKLTFKPLLHYILEYYGCNENATFNSFSDHMWSKWKSH